MLMRRKTFAASATNPKFLTHHNFLQEPRKVLLKTWKGPEETWDTENQDGTVRELVTTQRTVVKEVVQKDKWLCRDNGRVARGNALV